MLDLITQRQQVQAVIIRIDQPGEIRYPQVIYKAIRKMQEKHKLRVIVSIKNIGITWLAALSSANAIYMDYDATIGNHFNGKQLTLLPPKQYANITAKYEIVKNQGNNVIKDIAKIRRISESYLKKHFGEKATKRIVNGKTLNYVEVEKITKKIKKKNLQM